MKVFIYERVSSEEQAKHGYSLDAQHEALTEFCKAHNHIILGEYRDEGISGRKPYTKRPAMLQLLQDVKIIKPDMILFTKLDRWFRNIKGKTQGVTGQEGIKKSLKSKINAPKTQKNRDHNSPGFLLRML